jgi:hypothetical protein
VSGRPAPGHDPIPEGSIVPSADPAADPGTDDIRLTDLATAAVDAIAIRTARGEDLRTVVVDVIRTLFDAGTGDPESVARLVDTVLAIIRPPEA